MKKNPVVHFEIPVDDTERAMNFYTKTFGWEFNAFEMPATSSTGGNPYYAVMTTEVDEKKMSKTPGVINGGLMKRKHPDQRFMNYISVESIDNMLDIIKKNYGEILMPKTEIAPGMGWIAVFKDTENNIMGLHEVSYEMREKMEN